MPRFEGYADPGFVRELDKLRPEAQALVRATLRELADDPARHAGVKAVVGSAWPGTVRVRCGAFRVLALMLPAPRVLLFTTVFRKRREGDYVEALRRHDKRVAAQGPPIEEYLEP